MIKAYFPIRCWSIVSVRHINRVVFRAVFTCTLIQRTNALSETGVWTEQKCSSVPPEKRHFHSSVLYNGALYIFGGKSNGYHNDMFRFDFGASCSVFSFRVLRWLFTWWLIVVSEKSEWSEVRYKSKKIPHAVFGHTANGKRFISVQQHRHLRAYVLQFSKIPCIFSVDMTATVSTTTMYGSSALQMRHGHVSSAVKVHP